MSLLQSALPAGVVREAMLSAYRLSSQQDKNETLLEIVEPGSVRRSFDIKLDSIECRVSQLEGVFPEIFSKLITEQGDSIISHIASGTSRDGKPFITIYFGAERIK